MFCYRGLRREQGGAFFVKAPPAHIKIIWKYEFVIESELVGVEIQLGVVANASSKGKTPSGLSL
jgi:hypothetical protein